MQTFTSIAIPSGPRASTCGYCSPPGERSEPQTNFKSASLSAIKLACQVYQDMIDRGWRRSGTYCYKPDMRKCCCPQYAIRLDALAFKPSKSHRKMINRWNRFVLHSKEDGNSTAADAKVKRSKGKDNVPFDLVKSIHKLEEIFLNAGVTASHQFQVNLEPSSFTQEKYILFCKYQRDVHHDDDSTPKGFERFLVETPLEEEPIPYPSAIPAHLPRNYGSYHQMYRLDGQLIAMGVLDILPSCVSSVYFMYDSAWIDFELGKLSALREIVLAREIREAGVPGIDFLYMGYYIYSCQKMRYKGEYTPSCLLDPETYEWYPLDQCIPLLQGNRYACFSSPAHCIEGAAQNISEEPEPSLEDLNGIYVLQRKQGAGVVAVPLPSTSYWNFKQIRRDFGACTNELGIGLAEMIAWAV